MGFKGVWSFPFRRFRGIWSCKLWSLPSSQGTTRTRHQWSLDTAALNISRESFTSGNISSEWNRLSEIGIVSRTLARAAGFFGSVDGYGSFKGEHESMHCFFLVLSVPDLDSVANIFDSRGADLPCARVIECGMSTRKALLFAWKRIAVSRSPLAFFVIVDKFVSGWRCLRREATIRTSSRFIVLLSALNSSKVV